MAAEALGGKAEMIDDLMHIPHDAIKASGCYVGSYMNSSCESHHTLSRYVTIMYEYNILQDLLLKSA